MTPPTGGRPRPPARGRLHAPARAGWRWRVPVDPRLWRHARSFRRWVAGSVALGLGVTGCLVAQATFLAAALADAMGSPVERQRIDAALLGLLLATLARAGLAGLTAQVAARAAARTKVELRSAALSAVLALGASAGAEQSSGALGVTLGQGLDALDGYIGGYLPRVLLAVLAPVVLLAWVAHLDLLSAGILFLTLALLPGFVVLLNQLTRARVAARWQALTRLSGQFLDAVDGLATLRAFGRARAQRDTIAAATDRLRRTTLATLQVALLSALVLETLAAVGTALVAVPLGLRLLSGQMLLAPALAILVLTPEVYLPLRRAAADFHASTSGLAALDAVFALLEGPASSAAAPGEVAAPSIESLAGPGVGAVSGKVAVPAGRVRRPGPGGPPAIDIQGARVVYPGREVAALGPVELSLASGERLGVVGPSGAGKSTLLGLLTGLVTPTAGRVLIDGEDLRGLDLGRWRARVAWVPQRPTLFSASVAEKLRLGDSAAPDARLWAALEVACLAEVVAALPGGLAAQLGEAGQRLSAGERQRLGVARALVRDRSDVVLLDEPTAHLDLATEAELVTRLRAVLAGRDVLVVTHRPRVLDLVDRVASIAPDGRRSGAALAEPAGSTSR